MSVIYLPFSTNVTYKEMERRESIALGEDAGVRKLRCAWGDRITLARDLVGSITSVGDLQYVVKQPAPHPAIPGIVAIKVDIEGSGIPDGGVYADTSVIEHTDAVLSVQYGASKVTTGGGDDPSVVLGDERISGEANFLQLPGEKVFWDASQEDPLDNVDAPTILQVVDNWDVTLEALPQVPAGIWNLRGYVNSDSVVSARWGKTFEPETLLLADAMLSSKIVSDGSRSYDVQIRMSYRPTGWNKFFRRGGDPSNPGTSYKPIYDGSGAVIKPYPVGSFSALLALVGS